MRCLAVTFGSFLLSPSGKKLLYIAEKVEPKTISYFDTQDSKNHISSSTNVLYLFILQMMKMGLPQLNE